MRTPFKIPLQSEVEMYIREKMNWPDEFVKHYASKFWNHYQASGWKLSSGNSIKDWKACFNSQWQRPKFKEDIEMLHGKQGQIQVLKMISDKQPLEIQALDKLLNAYKQHPTSVPFVEFGKYYDYLKEGKFLKTFTKGEVENLRQAYPGDNFKCRCACVQMTFDGYVNSGITFSDIMNMRQKLV